MGGCACLRAAEPEARRRRGLRALRYGPQRRAKRRVTRGTPVSEAQRGSEGTRARGRHAAERFSGPSTLKGAPLPSQLCLLGRRFPKANFWVGEREDPRWASELCGVWVPKLTLAPCLELGAPRRPLPPRIAS